MIHVQERRQDAAEGTTFLLTSPKNDGKKITTVDELKQRRFKHLNKEQVDDEVFNQGNSG